SRRWPGAWSAPTSRSSCSCSRTPTTGWCSACGSWPRSTRWRATRRSTSRCRTPSSPAGSRSTATRCSTSCSAWRWRAWWCTPPRRASRARATWSPRWGACSSSSSSSSCATASARSEPSGGDDAVADLDRLADQPRAVVALRMNDRLDLRRHLLELIGQAHRLGPGEDRGDEDDEEGALPDLPDRLGGRLGLDHAESLRVESPGQLLTVAGDLIDYQYPVGRGLGHRSPPLVRLRFGRHSVLFIRRAPRAEEKWRPIRRRVAPFRAFG